MLFERRAWGWYLTLLDFGKFKVKLLRFNKPKVGCSLQYHLYRNELWLFLSGFGLFQLVNKEDLVRKGAWKLVGQCAPHRYIPTEKTFVLEIQYGIECEERDIVRLS